MDPEERFGLSELADEAEVSVRTVRYYIAEGLLPPPIGAGAGSHYTRAHLDRLRLIGRLKEAYLPLREIRRRLAGLDDGEVRRLLSVDADGWPVLPPETEADRERRPGETPSARELDSASSYIARVLGAPPSHPASLTRHPGALRARMPAPAPGRGSMPPGRERPGTPRFATLHEPEVGGDLEAGAAWRRIPLGDDAELLIREEAYRRRRDRVDWLVRWARKVFD